MTPSDPSVPDSGRGELMERMRAYLAATPSGDGRTFHSGHPEVLISEALALLATATGERVASVHAQHMAVHLIDELDARTDQEGADDPVLIEAWEAYRQANLAADIPMPLGLEQALAEAKSSAEAAEARCAELTEALVRIALKDRHGRIVKPQEDGGFRGVGGMLAVFALTGKNGSFVLDKEIAEQYPAAFSALFAASSKEEGK